MTQDLTRLRQLAGMLTEAPMTKDGQYVRHAEFIQRTIRNALKELPDDELEMLLFSLADDVRFLKLSLEKRGVKPGFDVDVSEPSDGGLPDSYTQPSPFDRRRPG